MKLLSVLVLIAAAAVSGWGQTPEQMKAQTQTLPVKIYDNICFAGKPLKQVPCESAWSGWSTGWEPANPVLIRPKRSPSVRAHFQHLHPCPATGKKIGACPGYRIDHVNPLACGGADDPANMQWQTIAEAKAKDKWERKSCQK